MLIWKLGKLFSESLDNALFLQKISYLFTRFKIIIRIVVFITNIHIQRTF